MNLDELNKAPLTDFKKHLSLDQYEFIGTNILAFFAKKGFKFEGQGSFGIVMSHPDLEYVIKLFDATDKGYPAFIEFANGYPDKKHLPKFIGKPMKIAGDVHAIRMEHLSKPSGLSGMFPFEHDFRLARFMSSKGVKRTPDGQIASEEDRESLRLFKLNALDGSSEAFVDLMIALGQYAYEHDIRIDLRLDNVMRRDEGPIVVTDPFVKF